MSHSFDVIVIGSGAGGGTLIHHLAPSGTGATFANTALRTSVTSTG